MKVNSTPSTALLPTFQKGEGGRFCGDKCLRKHRKSPPAPLLAKGGAKPAGVRRIVGFTLVEVLVALAILAIALAAAARAASVATDNAQETRLRTLATWIAQNRVAELNAANDFPSAGISTGKTNMAGNEFDWQQTVTDTPNAAFRKVELKIAQAGNTRTIATLNAYLVRAPGSVP